MLAKSSVVIFILAFINTFLFASALAQERQSHTVTIKVQSPGLATMSKDGCKVAFVGEDGILRIFDATNGRELSASSRQVQNPTAIVISPDGEWVAVACEDKSEKAVTRKPIGLDNNRRGGLDGGRGVLPEETLKKKEFSVTEQPSFNSDKYTINLMPVIKLYSSKNCSLSKETPDLQYPIESVIFSLEDSILIAIDLQFNVIRWNVSDNTTEISHTMHDIRRNYYSAAQSSFSHDGREIASLASEAANQRIVIKLYNKRERKLEFWNQGDIADVAWAIAISPDGERIMVGGPSNRLDVWNVQNRRREASIVINREVGSGIAFLVLDPSGSQAFVGELGGRVGLWDLASKSQIFGVRGPRRDYRFVSFLDSRVRLLSGGYRRVDHLTDLLTVEDFSTVPPKRP